MTTAPVPPVPAVTDLGRVFAGIVACLITLICRAFLRDPRRAAVGVPLRRYLNRTARRFDRLLVRLAAGKVPKPRPRRPATDRPQTDKPQTDKPRVRFSRKRAWLAIDLGYQGRGFASQINFLLDSPEHAPLIAASPQAHRLLRPLCRMLGISPSCIPPLPPRPRKPRPPREPKPRPIRQMSERRAWASWRPSPPRLFQHAKKPT
jgi:hypothetical protein